MASNRDFSELLAAFAAAEVRYLVVGGYAVAHHARPRFTKDLDVWVEPTPANAARVWRALTAFGAPLTDVRLEDFTDPDAVYQIGVAPNRIDVLMGIPAVEFSGAWSRRSEGNYGGQRVHFLSREDLIANKRAVGRPQDMDDVRALEAEGGDAETE
jgi:hypothetical protein